MFFWLKKLISYWFMPLSFTVGAILIGVWLMSRPKWERVGKRLVMISAMLLLLFSNKWVGRALLRPIETQYPPIPELVMGAPLPVGLADCRYVIVLGSGNGSTPGYAANNLLWSPGVARLMEGVRLLRALPSAKLIVTGPGTPEDESHARVLGRAAQSLGVDPDRMLYVEDVRDTEDESRAVARLVGGDKVAVVTSAWHMRRSIALFRSAGVSTTACPTEYMTHAEPFTWSFGDFGWHVQALGCSTMGIRERVGYAWIWLRGKAG